MLEPAERLMKLADEFNVHLVFFVDVGYLVKGEMYQDQFPELKKDLNNTKSQIKEMVSRGHDVQLHIHPHWEKSEYKEGHWIINADGAYKLDDFSDTEIRTIVVKYKEYLDELIESKTTAFRAGGWCIQPFSRLKEIFNKIGIRYDSSVIPGMKYESQHYSFDFSMAPSRSHYNFSDNESVEDNNGPFTEYPISSWTYSPLFHWKLYILGRLFPKEHKMLGDGNFIPQPGRKKKVLTSASVHHVSSDGFYASSLQDCLLQFQSEGQEDMVIIGHPKSMTEYSFRKLRQFISRNYKNHNFKTFRNL